MALIGNSHDEAQKILTMLERFLSFYGMSLNAGKCGYQHRTENPLYRPPPALSRWGNIPTHHGSSSYKYLGYFINMRLDFKYQYESMVQKLNDSCMAYYSTHPMSIKEAVTYVNSDLISKLRFRMYLIHFPKSYLERFETICVRTVKRLARLALSTPTDLLITEGLYNIENLQSAVRAEFMQNRLQAVDTPCRLTSQISYTHLKYDSLKGISPFSHEGLRDGSWTEKTFSPIFAGVRNHLRNINMSLLILFDTQVNILSHNISDTLAPLALLHLDDLATQSISRTHVTRLFSNLDRAHTTTLDDISPLFDAPIARPTSHPLHRQKGRAPRTLEEILPLQSSVRILQRTFASPMLASSNASCYASCCISFLNEYSNRMLKMHLIICKRQAPIGEKYKNTLSRLLLPIQMAVHAKMERAQALASILVG
jgi:hypothetical protein